MLKEREHLINRSKEKLARFDPKKCELANLKDIDVSLFNNPNLKTEECPLTWVGSAVYSIEGCNKTEASIVQQLARNTYESSMERKHDRIREKVAFRRDARLVR